MIEIEVVLEEGDVGRAMERAADALGLTIAGDGSLHKYSGSRHWHLKRGNSAGTLEATYWPSGARFWVCCHANRIGDGWVLSAAPRLAEALSVALRAEEGDR